jgi:hypothetical protein
MQIFYSNLSGYDSSRPRCLAPEAAPDQSQKSDGRPIQAETQKRRSRGFGKMPASGISRGGRCRVQESRLGSPTSPTPSKPTIAKDGRLSPGNRHQESVSLWCQELSGNIKSCAQNGADAASEEIPGGPRPALLLVVFGLRASR